MNFFVLLFRGFLVAGLLGPWPDRTPSQAKGADNAQTVLFIMSCAAAWLGILNGTKEIVKEQDIYARERRYGLSAGAYVLSKFVVLALVGAIQIGSLLILMSLWMTFPARGAIAGFVPVWLEWFVALELTLVAGLALGLYVSASFKTVDAATAIMFVILLIQGDVCRAVLSRFSLGGQPVGGCFQPLGAGSGGLFCGPERTSAQRCRQCL